MTWQPIETAPKGVFVDLWVVQDGRGRRVADATCWTEGRWSISGPEDRHGWQTMHIVEGNPTHWMPSPEPPEDSLSEAG